ncbi:MAG: polysaccharide biosynthesis tyrosine autokinase [Armatimonadetes bacterium]|nr:polysaccharide biosynthesis tyrosine autokinase [Armatimonadota bacterium]
MTHDNEESRLARLDPRRSLAREVETAPLTTLEPYYEVPPPGLREYVNIFRRRKGAIVISLIAVFALTVVITAVTPRTYEATATLLISEIQENSSSSDGSVPANMAAMGSPNLDTHVQLLQGESTAEETAKWLQQNGGPLVNPGELRSIIAARAVRDTQLIRISARAQTTEDAQKIANAAATTYVSMNRQRARGTSETTGRHLAEQLAIAKQSLTKAENKLRDFRESTGTIANDAAASELLGRAAGLRSASDSTAADLAQARERASRIRAKLAEQNMSIQSGQVRDNTVIQQLRAKLAELQGERLAAQARYTPEYPGPLAQINEQIRLVEKQLEDEVRHVVRGSSGDLGLQQSLTSQLIQAEAEAAALKARHAQLQSDLRQAEVELGTVPSRQITLADLQRQVDVAQNVYSDLLQRSQQIEVGRVMALGNADIVEPASMPRLPVKPNVPLNLVLGLLLGLSLGVGVALIQDQLDDRLRDQSEAARLAEAPVLGAIPVFGEPSRRTLLPARVHETDTNPVEAYRALRYCLDFMTQGERGRVVLVTSPGPAEGKSTTVLNLARTVALTGRRTVLVDGDLRRSGLGRMMGIKVEHGLTDVLKGEATLEQALHKCSDGLMYLGSGSQAENATELLDSGTMRDVIRELRQQADIIILDSPPVLAVADTLVLANLSDATLMVCVAGQSSRHDLQLARSLLARVGEKVSGIVLNKLGQKAGYGYQDRYHYYN